MACGCGKAGAVTRQMARTSTRSPRGGAYPLFNYPDCESLHVGAFQGDSILVVARGTDVERMFNRHQLDDAVAFANEVRRDIENIPTAALCDAAVRAVLG